MVEKIDRPEAPAPYQITRAKDAKEDQHKPPDQREEQEKRYQKQLEDKTWDKFDKKATTIKPLRVARGSIGHFLFVGAFLRSGVGILKADVLWKDGRKTYGALLLLSSLEDFFHLKKFKPGQEIPEYLWAKGPIIEMGILQEVTSTSHPPMSGTVKKEEVTVIETGAPLPKFLRWISWFGMANSSGTQINWGIVVLFLFLLTIVLFAILTTIK